MSAHPKRRLSRLSHPFLTALALVGPNLALAEQDVPAAVSIELNAVTETDAGCSLAFMVINGHQAEIGKVVYEMVFFDAEGRFGKMALFDFGNLPPARPRVRQFVVGDMACNQLSRVLINGASACDGAGDAACTRGLQLHSRTGIEVIG